MAAIRFLNAVALFWIASFGMEMQSQRSQTSQNAPSSECADNRMEGHKIERIDAQRLPNAVRVHDRVISGGLPEDDAAFAELHQLGIKTIISVDGAMPDLATAQKYGMRYVHLPHGYDGVPEQRAKELAKSVRDLPGPIYIHCHHGKHRSPAAAAVACVGAGLIGHEEAAEVLRVAGTSESYRGLYQSANDAQILDAALLDALSAEFPSIAKLPAMAEAMVAIEQVYNRLKAFEKAGWRTLIGRPDLAPGHEALLLREHFTEMLRTKELTSKPEEFQQLTQAVESAARSLEVSLRSPIDVATTSKLFATVTNNCMACHQSYRDNPLGKK